MLFFLPLFIIEMFLKKNLPLFHLLNKGPADLDKEIELLTKNSIKYIDKSIYKIHNEIEKFYRIKNLFK